MNLGNDVEDRISQAKNTVHKIFKLLKEHHQFISSAIPLIASENVTSISVREALITDFQHRYAEGWPGERLYAGCKYIDEVELLAIQLAKKVYDAEFADVRPISGVVANLVAYSAFAEPGDVMIALTIPHGGHISWGKKKWGGTAGVVRGLRVERYEFNEEEYEIDVDGTRKRLEEKGIVPKLFILGGSVILFPQPVKEIASLAKHYNAYVIYDAAHVAGLIAGGIFQDPLREGADIVTMSTHKTLAGPQHGMILSKNEYSELIKKVTFPGLVSNHHLHAVAALAVALAEALAYYQEYSKQIVRNAKALAQALYENGLDVLYEHKGFTETHQVVADVRKYGNGKIVEEKLERVGILINRNLIPRDYKEKTDYRVPSGIRIGVQEVTRLGMKEDEMKYIAELIMKTLKGHDSEKIRGEVEEFRANYQRVHYCFDSLKEAYKYISLINVT